MKNIKVYTNTNGLHTKISTIDNRMYENMLAMFEKSFHNDEWHIEVYDFEELMFSEKYNRDYCEWVED